MKNRNLVVGLLVGLLLLLIYVTVVRRGGSDATTVGSILILSGDFASYGEQFRNGAALGAKVANAEAEAPIINLEFHDSLGQKAKALELVKTLHERDGVMYLADIMGSGLALEAAPVAGDMQMLVLSGVNTGPELTRKGGDYFFRIIPSDGVASQQLAAWASDLGVDRVAIVHDVDDWATGLMGELTASLAQRSIGVVADVDCSRGFQLFGPLVNRIKASAPEVVFLLLYPREAGLLIKEARRQGLEAGFIGTDNFTGAELVEHGGEAIEGVLFVLPAEGGGRSAEYEEFKELYQNEYGREGDPELFSITGYDVAKIIADLVSRFGNDTAQAVEFLKSASYEGASGQISFDENGDLAVRNYERMRYFRLEDGAIRAQPITSE